MNLEIITIGDELLLGFTVDTNAAHLARELAAVGVAIVRRATVGDDADAIAAAVREAIDRTGAVITTGGLGPTSDDLTKPAIAALFGRGMRLDEEHLAGMRDRWRQRWGREMPESNRQQAMLPDGARKLVNRHGSAPGIWLEDDRGRWVAMLPGVPREMRGMLADTLLPLVLERTAGGGAAPTVVRSRTVRTTGVAESLLADRVDADGGLRRALERWAAEGRLDDGVASRIALAYLPSADGVDLRVTASGVERAAADAALELVAEWLGARVGDCVYGRDGVDLAEVVVDLCRRGATSLAVAESCTGGLLGARLTAIPGSSDVFLGGVIAYHNDVKRELLGVCDEDLREHGAVSEPVARQMAAGARARTGARVGVGVTGVAGPGGGTPEKPVGTVWIAVDVDGDVRSLRLLLFGDRDEIRRRAAQAALELVRKKL